MSRCSYVSRSEITTAKGTNDSQSIRSLHQFPRYLMAPQLKYGIVFAVILVLGVYLALDINRYVTLSSTALRFLLNNTTTQNVQNTTTKQKISLLGTETVSDSIVYPPGLVPRDTSKGKINEKKSYGLQYKQYINKIEVECQQRIRFGKVTDGGWDVCMVGPYMLTKPCLVYSFGIAGDWSFDDAIAARGCDVRSFDPTIKLQKHKRGERIQFTPLGFGGSDRKKGKMEVRTLKTLMELNGDTGKTIDLLKFDIEASEWETLPQLFSNDMLKTKVKQMVFEAHPHGGYKAGLEVLLKLRDHGFLKWHSHYNPACMFQSKETGFFTHCQELYYINTNFLK